eukprot:GHVU01078669.1.p1 GENE.GHVU01078669.1~~GHVU01078669.1.p1  ORF type:complete len:258 (+),score=39.14 GHVU01078669.1:1842-2615(+)
MIPSGRRRLRQATTPPCVRAEQGNSGAARVTVTRGRVDDEWEVHDLDLNLEDEALSSPDKEAGDSAGVNAEDTAAADQRAALEADLEGALDNNEDAEEDEAISRILSSEGVTRESRSAFPKRDSRKALMDLLNSNPEFYHSDQLVSECSGAEDEETATGIEDTEESRHAEAALHSIAAMSEDKKQRKALPSETEMYEYARSVLSEGAVMQLLRRKFFDPKHVTGPVVDGKIAFPSLIVPRHRSVGYTDSSAFYSLQR